MSIHSCIGFIYYSVVGEGFIPPGSVAAAAMYPGGMNASPTKRPAKFVLPIKNAALSQAALHYAFSLAGRLNSTSIKKMQPNPSASHSVKGEPSASVLMAAAVTGSAKL